MPSEISPAFDGHVQATAALLHLLRTLIFEVADETPGIGELTETLKWGQPSYTPKKPRIGSSVRLSATDDGRAAVWFICHTHLVDRFREIYPETFAFEGNRGLLFSPGEPLPEAELRHCIAMALTFHLAAKRN